MFDCLQQPVPDQALRLRDQGVERIGTRQCCIRLTLERQDTDLRAVAVGDDDARARETSGASALAARRTWCSWMSASGFSPRSSRALPPRATTILTAASLREVLQGWPP